MKRLIASLTLTLGLVLASAGTVFAAPRYWEVQMFDPAASTTERKINIAFNVFSTLDEDDDYNVELFENGASKGVQAISNPKGDSGAFSIDIPATGTYKYKIVASNIEAGESKDSAEKTVQVVDGPEPTVNTVFVDNEPNAPAGGVAAAAGGGGAAAGAEGGQVAGAGDEATGENGEGQVNANGDSTDEQGEGDVLGATEDKDSSNRGRNNTLVALAVLAAAGGAYYWLLAKPRGDR